MGDLKKKKVDDLVKKGNEEEKMSIDEQAIEKLREYMKLFLEKQREKQKDEE